MPVLWRLAVVAGSNFDNDHYVMCGADCDKCGGMVGYMKTEMAAIENWNRRTTLASGSGDQAELAKSLRSSKRERHGIYGRVLVNPDGPAAADALEALLAENAALRGERDQIAGESIWWKGVIGDGPYRPSGEVRSIKHLHPAMVKPIYEANKGTAVADVIAGLIFLLAINQNREQFLVADANERRTEAERKLAEAVEAMEEIAAIEPKPFEGGLDMEAIRACEECRRYEGHPVQHGICNTHRRPIWDREKHEGHEEKALGYRAKSIARTFLSKEAERG